MLILYLSGLVFFLIQAVVYARLSGPRVLGAVVWPLAILCVPGLIAAFRLHRAVKPGGRMASMHWTCFYFGDEPGQSMWGIGA